MSFIKIGKNNFEYVTVALRPQTSFLSSSAGVTGSNFVSPIRSPVLKQSFPNLNLDNIDPNDKQTIAELRSKVAASPIAKRDELLAADRNPTKTNISSEAQDYLDSINAAQRVEKFSKAINIFRFDLPVTINANRSIKNIVRKTFMPYHKHRYDSCNFSYSNYHTLNFFHSTTVPTGSALIYPNVNRAYDLPTNFCVNFWINPRYSYDNYRAGTILHMSSSLAISLVSGSSTDKFGQPDTFKILVQLSQSADKTPSSVNLRNPSTNYPNDLIFTSSHFLTKNHWHNVTVQWSPDVNNSSGSIFIDDKETRFHVPSSSLSVNTSIPHSGSVVGNYYDGNRRNLAFLLNNASGAAEGFTGMAPTSEGVGLFSGNTFGHPLNAEIHELKIYNRVFSDATGAIKLKSDLQLIKETGPSNFDNLIFYVPPFFYPTSSLRQVLTTPFEKTITSTDDPINVAFSLGKNGKMINLENFTRDFIVGQQPRLFGLVPQTIDTTIQNITADQFVYDTGSHKKRNFSILPNDNGLFIPNYFALKNSEMSGSSKFYEDSIDKKGSIDYSMISLEDLIPSSSLHPGLIQSRGQVYNAIVSASAQNPGVNKGAVLTIAQRTKDRSTNEIVIYDISNLYYGNRINPGSFELFEDNLTGSEHKISIKIKDNERGSLYRADALTKHATWNNIGNVFYDEGISIIKTPHLLFFNKDKTNIKFKGEQNLHTMILNVPAFANMLNSSSNPTFKSLTPSTGANDEDLSTLYVTTVNIHDDNFNIIMKANFAQPIFKTEEDEFIIRLKEDF
jgi:hypothetical protein